MTPASRRSYESDEELRLEVENLDLRRLLAQAGIDAAEQRTAEQLQRILLEELHHRIKNTLATVLAITSQTLRNSNSLEHGREAVANRLIALGRVHDLLLQSKWESTSFAHIVAHAIDPFDAGGVGRFVVQRADIAVSPAAVLPLAMVLNELCTNAVKYGALSAAGGRVAIGVVIDTPGDRFRLTWTESGGPPVKPPRRRSFGSRLIEHSLVSQLHGEAKLIFDPAGVVCTLDIPLASLRPRTPL